MRRGRAASVCARLLLALAAGGCAERPQAPAGAPNVLLVSIDTLRADALEPYGGRAPTPHLARLAREGVVFEQALAPAPSTAPSHASLFTGQEPLRHGVVRNAATLPDAALTLAERFGERGYRSAAFVSSFILDPRFGWRQGFDHYDASFSEADASVAPGRGAPEELWQDFSFRGFDRRAEATTRAARAWLGAAQQPVFLFVHYFDPHSPYVPPDHFARVLPPAAVDLRGRGVPGMSAAELRRAIRLYHGEVAFVDAALGELVADLVRLARPSLVVVTADHGEGLGQRGLLDHALHLHEELLHVPLLFWWSDRSLGGRRVRAPVGLVDVAPTIAELAGLEALPAADGHSLAPSVLAGREPPEREIVGHRRRLDSAAPGLRAAMDSVRLGRWKLVRSQGGDEALYDLESDPGETRDLRAEQPELAARLGEGLAARLARGPAAGPEPEPAPEVREALEALGYTE